MLVGSDRFAPLARRIAASLGAPWLPEVVVPHPIGGIGSAALDRVCDQAWEGLRQVMEDDWTVR